MAPVSCTHEAARALLSEDDAAGAVRVAGALLEQNPLDLSAWRLAALGVLELGDRAGAFKNLRGAALAQAEAQRPILALAAVKEIERLGGDASGLVEKIARLYGAGSERVSDVEIEPPPLPPAGAAREWGPELTGAALLSRAADAMAMAWGATLAAEQAKAPLPFVPLLSALDPGDIAELYGALALQVAAPDEPIIEQGGPGDAMFIVAEGEVAVVRDDGGVRVELARLAPGAFFGEMSLVSSAPRAAEVRAASHAVLLRADKAAMDALSARAPRIGDVLVAFCHARMLENLMRISPVLSPVPARRRPDVIARFGTDFCEAGETIIDEGAEGKGLFLVVSGAVRVLRREGGDVVHLATLGPGDLFGEISLVMRKPSTASVVAERSTALLFLSRAEFHEATRDFPELLKGAFDIAVERETQNNSIIGRPARSADDLILV
jgi:CRP-like cAMP-binding protein